jgi:hypothetical protein
MLDFLDFRTLAVAQTTIFLVSSVVNITFEKSYSCDENTVENYMVQTVSVELLLAIIVVCTKWKS